MHPEKLEKAQKDNWSCSWNNNYISHITLNPYCNIGMHTHDFLEVNIIVNGVGRHYIESTSVPAKAGDIFVIHPNVSHGYYNEQDLDVLNILLSRKFLKRFSEDLVRLPAYRVLFEIEPVLRKKVNSNLYVTLLPEQLSYVMKIYNLYAEKNYDFESEGKYIRTNAVCLELCSYLCECAESFLENDTKQAANKSVLRSIEYIKNNISQEISISEVAKMTYLSRSTYERHFKALTGATPIQYLQNCRLEAAKDMLLDSQKSIDEVAYECGFYDTSHLSKLFKKHYGISPSQYKGKKK